jgi:hypothetical protein
MRCSTHPEIGDFGGMSHSRTLIAARSVAEALVEPAVNPAPETTGAPFPEIAGPRPGTMVAAATLLAAKLGGPAQIIEGNEPDFADREQYENGSLLPSAHAKLAGPTFADWIETAYPA